MVAAHSAWGLAAFAWKLDAVWYYAIPTGLRPKNFFGPPTHLFRPLSITRKRWVQEWVQIPGD